MRKKMFWGIILALLVVVSACEKPILDGGQTKKKGFRVSVTVGVGEKAIAGAKSRALVDIDEVCSCLNAAVYKDGVKQNVINQKKGDKNFGTLNFNLPEGDYLLVVIGHSGTKNVSLAHADKVKFGFTSMKAAVTAEVRLDDLNKIEGGIVTLESLKAANVLTKDIQFAKVILAGEVKVKLVVRGLRVTKGAKAAIEAVGGSIEE